MVVVQEIHLSNNTGDANQQQQLYCSATFSNASRSLVGVDMMEMIGEEAVTNLSRLTYPRLWKNVANRTLRSVKSEVRAQRSVKSVE